MLTGTGFLFPPSHDGDPDKVCRVEGVRGCLYFQEACAFSIAGNLGIRAPPAQLCRDASSALRRPQLLSQLVRGSLDSLPQARESSWRVAKLCRPDQVHICDGSEEENRQLLSHMEEEGVIKRLKKYDN